jgi:predicted nucleotidyltransferase
LLTKKKVEQLFISLTMASINTTVIVKTLLGNFGNVEGIYIFGSHATGSWSEMSDIDIAFITSKDQSLPALQIFEVKSMLELSLKTDVDLIHLNSASTVFQFQIVTTGYLLFVNEVDFISAYESIILSQYQQLNEERKIILNSILSTGKVYA